MHVRLLLAVGLRIRCNEVWRHAQPSGRAGSCFTDWPTAALSEKEEVGISCDTEESDVLNDTATGMTISVSDRGTEVTGRLSHVFPMTKGLKLELLAVTWLRPSVCLLPVFVDAWDRSQYKLCRICSGQNVDERGFWPSNSAWSCQSCSTLHLIATLHNLSIRQYLLHDGTTNYREGVCFHTFDFALQYISRKFQETQDNCKSRGL